VNHLKDVLEKFYQDFDFTERLKHDPIEFPHRYKEAADIETVGFIASGLAYGKVELFKSVLETIFQKMGRHPHDFLRDSTPALREKLFSGIKYRFNETADLLGLFQILQQIILKYDSPGNLFLKYYSNKDPDIAAALAGFVDAALQTDLSAVYGKNIRPKGLLQLFPSPAKGSACKRANLFLRWMVRKHDIDFGIWESIPASKLVIPLDTHIAKISLCLGLTKRTSTGWKTAAEITDSLRRLDPEDPLKYDFALCHHGISGACKGRKNSDACRECLLI
jgi:uncharacterized protein (TIGR02757 family)